VYKIFNNILLYCTISVDAPMTSTFKELRRPFDDFGIKKKYTIGYLLLGGRCCGCTYRTARATILMCATRSTALLTTNNNNLFIIWNRRGAVFELLSTAVVTAAKYYYCAIVVYRHGCLFIIIVVILYYHMYYYV